MTEKPEKRKIKQIRVYIAGERNKKPEKKTPDKKSGFLTGIRKNLFSGDKDDVFEFEKGPAAPEGVFVIVSRKTGDEYPLFFGPDIIGSDESRCSIVLSRNHRTEPEHCSITFIKGRYRIADLNSRFGTKLNGVRLEPGKPYELSSADLIQIADEELVFSRRK